MSKKISPLFFSAYFATIRMPSNMPRVAVVVAMALLALALTWPASEASPVQVTHACARPCLRRTNTNRVRAVLYLIYSMFTFGAHLTKSL